MDVNPIHCDTNLTHWPLSQQFGGYPIISLQYPIPIFIYLSRNKHLTSLWILLKTKPSLQPTGIIICFLAQAFLLLPFQHSESLQHQHESVRLSAEIAQVAPETWRSILERYLLFAKQHLALIERFERFPHRNHILGRAATAEEEAYLSGGGARFGQGAH